GIEHVTLRLFFIYGPRQFVGLGYPSVIVRTFERIVSGKAPTVYGSGEQSLDYVYVDDAIEAMRLAAETPHNGEVFNVSTGVDVKVNDLLNTLSDLAGFTGTIEQRPADWTDGTHRSGDPQKSERLLGWKAATPLRE